MRKPKSGAAPGQKVLEKFGERLFQALFVGKIKEAWVASRGWIDGRNAEGLNLRLRIEPPACAALPWELLRDPRRAEFLATAADLGLSRYLPVPEPPPLPANVPLRVLLVVESPPGLAPIDVREVQLLETALNGLGGDVKVDVRHNLTEVEIHGELQHDYHVLHYLGHGTGGKLCLISDDRTKLASIDAGSFAQLVVGRRSLRLIVLNACYSSQAGTDTVFDGVGPALVRQRMPAVVAMQYETVQQETAGLFSRKLYEALGLGRPIDVAVNQARQALSACFLHSRDWSTPILYLGSRSFRLADPQGEEARESDYAWDQIRQSSTSPDSRVALSDLKTRFRDLVSRQQSLKELWFLVRELQQLQDDFRPCLDAVQGVVANINVHQLSGSWQLFRRKQLSRLQAFAQRDNKIEQAPWYQDLFKLGKDINDAVNQYALGALARSVTDFDAKLSEAGALVRQQTDDFIAEMVSFSDRTLGSLNL